VPVESDFLVLGSGLAGLTCALRCARQGRVLLVTKDRLPESNSRYAQGGIASVWSPEDSFEQHIDDTLIAGDGLCHRDAVEVVVREGPDRVRDLIALGTHFDLRGDPEDREYDLGQEGGHSRRRILHASDATGQEIIRALNGAPVNFDFERFSAGATATLFLDTDLTVLGDAYVYNQDPTEVGFAGVAFLGRDMGLPIAPLRYVVRPEVGHRFGDLTAKLWAQVGEYVPGTGGSTTALGGRVQYRFSSALKVWVALSGQRDVDANDNPIRSGSVAAGVGYRW